MSIEDTIGYQDEGAACVVCGKGLRPDEQLAVMHQGENRLPICCPLCLDAYQADPKQYLERLARRTFMRELRRVPVENSPKGPHNE